MSPASYLTAPPRVAGANYSAAPAKPARLFWSAPFNPQTCAMDKGYDNNRVYAETMQRGVVPIICLRKGRAIPLTAIPYGSDEWKRLYRGRAAVEREFGRLKNEYALTPLRTRGLARVRQHADLVMIARLGQALVRARAVPLAA
jgi:hypothetical protein